MAIARKCDVCGNLFEEFKDKDGDSNRNFLQIGSVSGTSWTECHKFDICPKCTKAVLATLKDLGFKGDIDAKE